MQIMTINIIKMYKKELESNKSSKLRNRQYLECTKHIKLENVYVMNISHYIVLVSYIYIYIYTKWISIYARYV